MSSTHGFLEHLWEISKTQGFPWWNEVSFTVTHEVTVTRQEGQFSLISPRRRALTLSPDLGYPFFSAPWDNRPPLWLTRVTWPAQSLSLSLSSHL